MTTPTADPAPTPPGPDRSGDHGDQGVGGDQGAPTVTSAPRRPAPRGLLAATAVIATIGVVVALLGIVLLLRPVSTPTQDCGTSLGFLLDGRVNVFVSEDDPPAGITPEEARANNAEPCRDRVADRAGPALVLFSAGLVAAIIAAVVEGTVRISGWLRRRRARRAEVEAAPAAAAADATTQPPQ